MLFSHKRFTNILGPKDTNVESLSGGFHMNKQPSLLKLSRETFFSRKESFNLRSRETDINTIANEEPLYMDMSNNAGKNAKTRGLKIDNEGKENRSIEIRPQQNKNQKKSVENDETTKRSSIKSGSMDFTISQKEILGHYQGSQEFSVKNILSLMRPASPTTEQIKNFDSQREHLIIPSKMRTSSDSGRFDSIRASRRGDSHKGRGKNLETRHSDIEGSNDINLSERNGSYLASKDVNAMNISERALMYSIENKSPRNLCFMRASLDNNSNFISGVNPPSIRGTYKSTDIQELCLPKVEEIGRESLENINNTYEGIKTPSKGDKDEDEPNFLVIDKKSKLHENTGDEAEEGEAEGGEAEDDHDEYHDKSILENEQVYKLSEPFEEKSEMSFQNLQANNNYCYRLNIDTSSPCKMQQAQKPNDIFNPNAITVKTASIDLSSNMMIDSNLFKKSKEESQLIKNDKEFAYQEFTGKRIKKPPALSEIFHSPRSSGFLPQKDSSTLRKNMHSSVSVKNLTQENNNVKTTNEGSHFQSPLSKGLSPKFYHTFVSQKINAEKSFGRLSFVKQQVATDDSIRHSRSKSGVGLSKYQEPALESHQGRKKTSLMTINSMNLRDQQQELNNFYINILKKIEILKFSVSFAQALEKGDEDIDLRNIAYTIDIENIKLTDNLEKESFQIIASKYGKEYFLMMKKIFSLYSVEKKDSSSLTLRQILKFCKDFKIFEQTKDLEKPIVEIYYSKRVPQKNCDFRGFVEILFKLSRHFKEEIYDRDSQFKFFLDDVILPTYKTMCSIFAKYNIERIQVFHQNFCENEVLELFTRNDNFLKHLYSLYEQIDVGQSRMSFISLNNFLRFCNDYYIIPTICSNKQVVKIFRIFQMGNKELIHFQEFIMSLCCIAHIGFSSPSFIELYKGFHKKIVRLIQNLTELNTQISEGLIMSHLMKSKE